MSDSPQYTPVPPQAAQSGMTDNVAGALAYATIIPAIIFLVVEPYKNSSFVRFHAWQCIFLYLAGFLIGFVWLPELRVTGSQNYVSLVVTNNSGIPFLVGQENRVPKALHPPAPSAQDPSQKSPWI